MSNELSACCPKTGQRISTGILLDSRTLAKLWQSTLDVACPHCGAGHLDDLLAFIAVGQERSFTKAAAKLGRLAIGAYQPLGALNTVLALAIAIGKALIVAAIFMELRRSNALTIAFAGAGFFWLASCCGWRWRIS